jgi:integrase
MPKKRLTEEGVARLSPPDAGTVDYYDAGMPGLVLRTNYGGRKVWRALYYVSTVAKSGKKAGQRIRMPTTHELGTYPVLKLKEARERARQFLADPQKALAQVESGSFKDVAENFIKRHVEANKLRTGNGIKRLFDVYIYPHWQHKPFRDIRRGDVADLLDRIEDNNGSRQADVVLAVIRKMMRWYAARNDDYAVPVVPGMKRHNGGKRARILDDDEIRAVWQACDEASTFGALVKTLLLTAQRRDKVATMQWSDLKDGVWTIQSEAREKSNAGSLKLPQAVLDVLAAQPRIAGNPHVFPGVLRQGRRRKDGALPTTPPAFNSFSQRKYELDEKLSQRKNARGEKLPDMKPWTIHDLRRTAKSLMARAGVRPDISERVLGHAIPGVEGVYDRHSYADEKAEALQRLADLVATILNPPEGNVVALRHGRGR